MVLLVTATGFDLLSVGLSGATIRLSYILDLLAFWALRRRVQFGKSQTILLALFAILSLIGACTSANVLRSVFYLVWVVFSYVVIFGLFAYFAREHRELLLRSLVTSFRLQIVCGLLLFVAHVQDRVHLLYYEASYFSMALAVYAALTFFRVVREGFRAGTPDLLLLLVALMTTKSATLLMGFACVLVIGFFLLGITPRKLLAFGLVLAVLVLVSYLYAMYGSDLVATTLASLYHTTNPILTIAERSGNRFPRLMSGWDTFQSHPWWGVGIGAFESYTATQDLSAYSGGSPGWRSRGFRP